ncbi:hypothetical protein LTR56_014232 [Elasticomyces elasticus]|nr:hypothetical protein LTR56_014232 [Elasticomyces elasticus]KAK3645287.1 hypothetical protein LTR22_014865 [Elasticomyces elasticus]KAK4917397.1 hypothetical protein LTR49_014751 [Elasticomyces elasticus]KAK5755131.1 hypothetical protein LTS12_014814 [Elasticomyces elasticus]
MHRLSRLRPPLHPLKPHQRNYSLIPRHNHLPPTLYRPTGEPVRTQTVRFTSPPFFTRRRTLIWAVYAGVGYLYLNLFIKFFEIEIAVLDDEEDTTASKEEDGVEITAEEEASGIFYADESSTFIPFTWPKPLPRTFYKGSDPEWKEFIKVAQNKPRHKDLQSELVRLVFSGSIKHPTVSAALGPNPKVGKYWLDISFPDAPPPEYVRTGIEVGEGYVAWSKQKVSQENRFRWARVVWPEAAARSLWVGGKTIWDVEFRRVKQAMGWEGRDPNSVEEKYRMAVLMMEKRELQKQQGRQAPRGGRTAQVGEGGAPPSRNDGGGATAEGADTVVTTPPGTAAAPPSDPHQSLTSTPPPPPSDPNAKWWQIPTPPIPEAIPIALHVATATLSKSWLPQKPLEPPRGSFVVQGLVEVKGERGRVMFDVQSAYDPKENKFVAVQASVRGVKRWRQSPRGGP